VSASPSGTWRAAGHNPASVPRGCRSQRAPPTLAHALGMPRSRKVPQTRRAIESVSSSGTRIAIPNGREPQTLAVSRISNIRAGRIAPSCCQDAAMKPASPNSVGATQLLKSSARGAPRHTRGLAIATNATTATAKIMCPARSLDRPRRSRMRGSPRRHDPTITESAHSCGNTFNHVCASKAQPSSWDGQRRRVT
jgi:hypothetical protein